MFASSFKCIYREKDIGPCSLILKLLGCLHSLCRPLNHFEIFAVFFFLKLTRFFAFLMSSSKLL